MRTLVVGDVHGCADELSQLLSMAQATRIILVGDCFTKGPDPAGVWRLICQHRCEAVLGNHDVRLLKCAAGERSRDAEGNTCVAVLNAADPSWLPWLAELPLMCRADRFLVVHAGVHPTGGETTRGMALSMRRFPPGDPTAVHWHQQYTAEQAVIFGHDARQGLVRVERNGRPLLLGLDTGCVYGGQLTGYLVESDELLQVQAARVYRPVTG